MDARSERDRLIAQVQAALAAGTMSRAEAWEVLGRRPYPVEATLDGVRAQAVIFPPATPSRRRSAPLSRYARLDPPIPDESVLDPREQVLRMAARAFGVPLDLLRP